MMQDASQVEGLRVRVEIGAGNVHRKGTLFIMVHRRKIVYERVLFWWRSCMSAF